MHFPHFMATNACRTSACSYQFHSRRRNRSKPHHQTQPRRIGPGSVQDTLDKKRGNAVDTASLLIALLRSAKIPARYVYGAVERLIDKAINWVGGAKTGEMAQGGVARKP